MIYTQKAYTDLHDFQNLQRFIRPEITMCVDLKNRTAISLPFSPSGGISIGKITKEQFHTYLLSCENELKSKGIKTFEITLAPFIYTTIKKEWLIEAGYLISNTEIAHYLILEEDLEQHLHEMQLRKLRKLSGMRYGFLAIGHLEAVYEFISVHRAESNIPLNVTYEKLSAMFLAFPDCYHIHSAYIDDKLVACCITVVPENGIAYYFLPATSAEARSSSPMVGLIHRMYQYYQNLKFRYIDLGISSMNGKPQESLIVFKERMGGIRTERNTFSKSLD